MDNMPSWISTRQALLVLAIITALAFGAQVLI